MQNPFTESALRLLEKLHLFFQAHVRDWRLYAGGIFFVLLIIYKIIFAVPADFPRGSIITLRSGAGLAELSETLKMRGVIRSAVAFQMVAILEGGERGIQAGDYALPARENVIQVAWRMVHGLHGLDLVKITIPEGLNIKEISKLFDTRFPLFNHHLFEAQAAEGYLFPDTYFIQTNATASSTIDFLQANFHRKVDPLQPLMNAAGRSLSDTVIMASVLEGEVLTDSDRKLVSGILWRRIKLGMPLQVDAAPETYKTKGLPAKPIGNPGLEALTAALTPTTSKYLYFLTDKTGKVHYAETFAEHDANIEKYLK